MDYNPRNIERLAKDISAILEADIKKIGIFYRIFYRCKPAESLKKKVEYIDKNGIPKYDGKLKFLRDVIGIRITLYFADDLEILHSHFNHKYELLEETIDRNKETEFKPTRTNLIFRIPEKYFQEFKDVVSDTRIDNSFELQLRTVLSEGWHEVDHDLRYKCKNDWENYTDISRTLNGILAALETNDWSILKIFEHLSYQHYRTNNWPAMFRTKFRIRLRDFTLDDYFVGVLNSKNGISKEIYRISREEIIVFLLQKSIPIPLTLNNLLFMINYFFINDPNILENTPDILLKEFSYVVR